MFFEQPLSEAFYNVDGKGFFKRKFLKGAPAGCLPPRRGGASAASTLIKVLPHIEQNAIEIFTILYLKC
jgi:hypothetical protein